MPELSENNVIVVMMSSDAVLPCVMPARDGQPPATLSARALADVLRWAAQAPTMPELFFAAGSQDPMAEPIAEVLQGFADRVVTPPLSSEQHDTLNVPFSGLQTVVISDLGALVAASETLCGRPAVIHVSAHEVSELHARLVSVEDSISVATLRPRNVAQWNDGDLVAYEEQLVLLGKRYFLRNAQGFGGTRITNVMPKGQNLLCGAGSTSLAIGPDGNVYPCPAYYVAGSEHALGAVREVASGEYALPAALQECSLCHSAACRGCPFLASTCGGEADRACLADQAERRATRRVMEDTVRSAYLLDGLQSLKAVEVQGISQVEGEDRLGARRQAQDITFDDLLEAMQDINLAACGSASGPASSADRPVASERWQEDSGIAPDSRLAVFRRRVRDVLDGIDLLAHYAHEEKGEKVGGGTGASGEPSRPSEDGDAAPPTAYPLTREQLDSVVELHELKLGWDHITEGIEQDDVAGLSCPPVLLRLAYRESEIAQQELDGWFVSAAREGGWSDGGYGWDLDFAGCRVIRNGPEELRLRAAAEHAATCRACGAPPQSNIVVPLGDTDVAVFQNLVERRAAFSDAVRSSLWASACGADGDREWNETVRELGGADHDVWRWFSEMAKAHGWPQLGAYYDVDIQERIARISVYARDGQRSSVHQNQSS